MARLRYNDVYSSSDESSHAGQDTTEVEINDYVVVRFTGRKKCHHYLGIVLEKAENELLVKFMKKSGVMFVFPDKEDLSSVDPSDVVAKVGQPSVNNRQQYTFSLNNNLTKLLQ